MSVSVVTTRSTTIGPAKRKPSQTKSAPTDDADLLQNSTQNGALHQSDDKSAVNGEELQSEPSAKVARLSGDDILPTRNCDAYIDDDDDFLPAHGDNDESNKSCDSADAQEDNADGEKER